jgi:hypothetical protein
MPMPNCTKVQDVQEEITQANKAQIDGGKNDKVKLYTLLYAIAIPYTHTHTKIVAPSPQHL